jgi:UDP-N-acetylmuramoylalanine--D-glutamate ligase
MASADKRAFAAGNIGLAVLAARGRPGRRAAEATAVCEVSSFQAERLGHFCADSLLWTNFAEDHLERHGSMESYFAAKWELVLRTPSGRFFVGSSVQRYAAQFGRPLPEAACVETEGQPEDPRLLGTPFASYPQRENFILAAAWWRAEGLERGRPSTPHARASRSAATGSLAGGHRRRRHLLERLQGHEFPRGRGGALRDFKAPVVLIAGGRSKGGDSPASPTGSPPGGARRS